MASQRSIISSPTFARHLSYTGWTAALKAATSSSVSSSTAVSYTHLLQGGLREDLPGHLGLGQLVEEAVFYGGVDLKGVAQTHLGLCLLYTSTHNKLGRDTLINIDIGCHYAGYASAYGRPILFGKMPDSMKKEIDFMLDLHERLICELSLIHI